jgi:hypothetical protein
MGVETVYTKNRSERNGRNFDTAHRKFQTKHPKHQINKRKHIFELIFTE